MRGCVRIDVARAFGDIGGGRHGGAGQGSRAVI